jgi:HPt (histidine-containing phosphotransfer) domain-containing protein
MTIDRRPIDQMVLDVGGEAFQRLARLFEDETRGAVVALRAVLADEDWRELGRQAHSLKHATSSFGLDRLASIAAHIERAADAHQGAEADAQVAVLEAEADAELAELDRLLKTLAA